MYKLPKQFYQRPAILVAKNLLGKYLVCKTPKGLVSGKIMEVEVYSAVSGDDSARGRVKTPATEVLYGEGGYAYVHMTYGMHFMFGVVVNKKDCPEVVFVRSLLPKDGTGIMKKNFERKTKNDLALTSGPGKLCKSFGINNEFNGLNLTGTKLYIEDQQEKVPPGSIITTPRIGLNPKLISYKLPLRFLISK